MELTRVRVAVVFKIAHHFEVESIEGELKRADGRGGRGGRDTAHRSAIVPKRRHHRESLGLCGLGSRARVVRKSLAPGETATVVIAASEAGAGDCDARATSERAGRR